MPDNPDCLLGLTALQLNDNFVATIHNVGTSLTLKTDSNTLSFQSKTDMDYIHNMNFLSIQVAELPCGTLWTDSSHISQTILTLSMNNITPKSSLKFCEAQENMAAQQPTSQSNTNYNYINDPLPPHAT